MFARLIPIVLSEFLHIDFDTEEFGKSTLGYVHAPLLLHGRYHSFRALLYCAASCAVYIVRAIGINVH